MQKTPERTMTGLAAAKARGRLGGRKRKLSPSQTKHAVDSDQKFVKDICNIVSISRGNLRIFENTSKRESIILTHPANNIREILNQCANPFLARFNVEKKR